ncbi:MAG: hypothetical protein KJI71_01850 [Patescibacteria group bacterium]|nr:hypothetical protein [Patescibacteria group bacterium]
MTYKTLAKICAAISGFSIVYMFLITYEGTHFGWTVFFVFLAFAVLFHALDEKEEEIEILRSPKESKIDKEEKTAEENSEIVFFRKNSIKQTKNNKQTKL